MTLRWAAKTVVLGGEPKDLRKGKERKSIYIAPFIYYVYLKALRHGSHSKYTMLAFPS